MKNVVIFQDPGGLSMRMLAMRRAHPNVIAVAPSSCKVGHCLVSDAPEEWLPDLPSIPTRDREWFKGDAMALAAVVNHSIDADFYWFIESDVAATQERWQAFFAEFENRRDDCMCLYKIRKGSGGAFAKRWAECPEDADMAFLMSCYRLSRRMVEASIEMAPGMRNVFCEMAVPLVAKRAGMKVSTLSMGNHYTEATVGPLPRSIRINPKLINHPIKTNTLGP